MINRIIDFVYPNSCKHKVDIAERRFNKEVKRACALLSEVLNIEYKPRTK